MFKELQRIVNRELVKRITMLEEWKKAEVIVHDSFNERLNHLERALLPHHHSPTEYRVEKLESEQKVMDGGLNVHKEKIHELQDGVEKLENLVGTLQQHSEDIFALEKENTVALEARGLQTHRLNIILKRLGDLEEQLSLHMGSGQLYDNDVLKRMLVIEGKLQDTVAELDPMGHIVVRSGIKEMKTGIPKKRSYTKREK